MWRQIGTTAAVLTMCVVSGGFAALSAEEGRWAIAEQPHYAPRTAPGLIVEAPTLGVIADEDEDPEGFPSDVGAEGIGYGNVRMIQRALARRGYFGGFADGFFGPMTRASIREFQADENLPVTGRMDAITAARLQIY